MILVAGRASVSPALDLPIYGTDISRDAVSPQSAYAKSQEGHCLEDNVCPPQSREFSAAGLDQEAIRNTPSWSPPDPGLLHPWPEPQGLLTGLTSSFLVNFPLSPRKWTFQLTVLIYNA